MSGMCVAEGKWLSDQEKINRTVERIITRAHFPIAKYDAEKKRKVDAKYEYIIKYKSVEEFLQRNPDCCKVGEGVTGDIWGPTFETKVLGRWGDPVQVNFTINYVDENGKQLSDYKEYDFVVSNCGIAQGG